VEGNGKANTEDTKAISQLKRLIRTARASLLQLRDAHVAAASAEQRPYFSTR
jgi:hypothetical protein